MLTALLALALSQSISTQPIAASRIQTVTLSFDGGCGQAVRFDAFTDRLTATGIPSSLTSYSVAGWAKIVTDRNAASAVWVIQNSGGTTYNELITDADGTTLAVYDNTTGRLATVGAMTVNNWFFFGMTVSGTTLTTYFAADSATSLTTASGTIASPTGADRILLGSSTTAAEFFNGSLSRVRTWNGVLSGAQMLQEFRQDIGAANSTGLIGDWLRTYNQLTDVLVDYSGTSNTLTSSGGALAIDGSACATYGRYTQVYVTPPAGQKVYVYSYKLYSLTTATCELVQPASDAGYEYLSGGFNLVSGLPVIEGVSPPGYLFSTLDAGAPLLLQLRTIGSSPVDGRISYWTY